MPNEKYARYYKRRMESLDERLIFLLSRVADRPEEALEDYLIEFPQDCSRALSEAKAKRTKKKKS